jgi:hypothetical protein
MHTHKSLFCSHCIYTSMWRHLLNEVYAVKTPLLATCKPAYLCWLLVWCLWRVVRFLNSVTIIEYNISLTYPYKEVQWSSIWGSVGQSHWASHLCQLINWGIRHSTNHAQSNLSMVGHHHTGRSAWFGEVSHLTLWRAEEYSDTFPFYLLV